MPTPHPDYDPNFVAPKKGGKRVVGKVSTPQGEVSASSNERGNEPSHAVDGSDKTRWAADGGSTPQWWMIEFPEKRALAGVTIHWKNKTWFDHLVEVSDDGKKWEEVAGKIGNRESRTEDAHDLETEAKFLRVTVEKLGSGWVSFTEIEFR
jgi:hypothetical protein